MIVVRLTGGLGNQMFQYALGRHLALKHRTELFLDTTYFDHISKDAHFVKRNYDLGIYDLKAQTLDPHKAHWLPYYSTKRTHRLKHSTKRALNLYKYFDNCLLLREKQFFLFDPEVLCSGDNVYLIGYWQNEKYFKDIEEEIRDDFNLAHSFGSSVHQLASEIANTASLCLHIRRKDFVNNPTHGFVGADYVARAFVYLKKRVAIEKVYVFSDDVEWCMNNLRLDYPMFVVPRTYAGIKDSAHLYLMTRCRHFIISNSTFGWWAAWLSQSAEKSVVAPKRWINIQGVDSSDLFPQDWIAI